MNEFLSDLKRLTTKEFLSDLKQMIIEDLDQVIRVGLIAVFIAAGFIGYSIYFGG